MKFLPPLMAIVDADIARGAGWPLIDLASAFLSGGATLLQLRAKEAPGGWLLDTASAIVTLAHQANARVIVNDRADIARLSGADGVHVGQDDLAPALVRQIVGRADDGGLLDPHPRSSWMPRSASRWITWRSARCSTPHEATGYRADRPRRCADRCRTPRVQRGLPLVAIGGITLGARACGHRRGRDSVAVISDLSLATGDPAASCPRRISRRLTV